MAPATSAFADVEPNNGITQVEGPLTGATTHVGEISTSDDVDWYVFYVSGQVQMDVSLTVPADSNTGIYSELMSTDGREIGELSASKNNTDHYTYTTPAGTTRYLLKFSDSCCGSPPGKYQFRMDTTPAGAVVDGPGNSPVTATSEPNETASQAFGPLTGGVVYGGAIETTNDVDWFTFYSAGTAPFDLALTNPGNACGYSVSGMLTTNPTDEYDDLASVSAEGNGTDHINYTPKQSEQYFFKVTSCEGAQVPVPHRPAVCAVAGARRSAPQPQPTPPTAPTTVSSACSKALTSQVRWRAKVKSYKRSLGRAHRRSTKRKLRKRLKAAKRTLRRVNDRVILNC